MIADLHCHYPMHLLEDAEPATTFKKLRKLRVRPRWAETLRAFVFRFLAREINYPKGWRVDFDGLEDGGCRLILSVLYDPAAEFEFDKLVGADRNRDYFADLMALIDETEDALRDGATRGRPDGAGRYVVVKRAADLNDTGRMAFVHCVEGGFHLGLHSDFDDRVGRLAEKGVAYITLAHLFYRGLATSANAFPMVTDRFYDKVHHQPSRGLSQEGTELVTAMHRHRVMVDLSHMREDAFHCTLDLLERLDGPDLEPEDRLPVLASHSGLRIGEQEYMLDADMVRRVQGRNGVIGLILARHQLQDGLCDGTTLDHTVAVVSEHARRIREITGSDRYVGIGSDLDGFIEPTMAKIERAEDLAAFEKRFREAYDGDADAILYGNAERVIRQVFELRG